MIVSLGACADIKPLALSPNPSVIVQIKLGEVEKEPKEQEKFPRCCGLLGLLWSSFISWARGLQ